MTMVTLDEILTDFCQWARAALPVGYPIGPAQYKQGLEHVLRKHIEPLIANTYCAKQPRGTTCAVCNLQSGPAECEAFAARIVTSIIEPKRKG